MDLLQLKRSYGPEVSLFILSCLVEAVDFNEPNPLPKDAALLELLSLELTELSHQSNFSSYVLRAFANFNEAEISVPFISRICDLLQLPIIQELALGLAFAQSTHTLVQDRGKFLFEFPESAIRFPPLG